MCKSRAILVSARLIDGDDRPARAAFHAGAPTGDLYRHGNAEVPIMIVGIGTDIVAVDRIGALRERRGHRGLRRLFAPEELDYCLGLARPTPSLAARFAAKEAFFKAIGTGCGSGGRWTDVVVRRNAAGAPRIELCERAARTARNAGVDRVHLSLSHTSGHAVAFVVLEG